MAVSQRKWDLAEVVAELKRYESPANREGMSKFGINTRSALGVEVNVLRKMAKDIGKDQALSQQLWDTGIHEARILATIVADPSRVTSEQMDDWVNDLDSWDLCDQCCGDLLTKVPFAYQKCIEWSSGEKEFVKRAGFVLMARLAVRDKKAEDGRFSAFLPIIEREAGDERNMVKKAVNWALRQIGKRNSHLNELAIQTAREMIGKDSKSARWIASDAIRELKSPAVQRRLGRTG